jgi:hypothetical protein
MTFGAQVKAPPTKVRGVSIRSFIPSSRIFIFGQVLRVTSPKDSEKYEILFPVYSLAMKIHHNIPKDPSKQRLLKINGVSDFINRRVSGQVFR